MRTLKWLSGFKTSKGEKYLFSSIVFNIRKNSGEQIGIRSVIRFEAAIGTRGQFLNAFYKCPRNHKWRFQKQDLSSWF
ncbi:UNVERIFIED_CONTAM: hypothetical protein NCL1_36233 [Trichonephila clavipes]